MSRSRVIIDPSIILVERTLESLEANIKELSEHFDLYISKNLYQVLKDGRIESSYDYFVSWSNLVDKEILFTFLEKNQDFIKIFEEPSWAKKEHHLFFESLVENLPLKYRDDTLLHSIIFEEWFFLQEYSWIVARTKKIFNLFIRSGAASIEYGRHVFDGMVRRTLWRENIELVTQAHRLRAVSKWIAAGGAAIANLSYPIVQVFADFFVTGYFILIDP